VGSVALVTGRPGAAAVTVRANRSYRLVDAATAGSGLDEWLAAHGGGMGPTHVLLGAAGSGLSAKAVDDAGARLIMQLSDPGGRELLEEDVLDLVLDEVLEVAVDGRWLAGPPAFEALVRPWDPPPAGDRLSRLSYEAVRRAARLPLTDAADLCGSLYGFLRRPVSRRWTRQYPDPAAVRDLLLRTANHDWIVTGGHDADWLHLRARGAPATALPYKIYVSPRVDVLPDAVPEVAAVLAACGVPELKVGAHAAQLLRPDRIVAYLPDVTAARYAARELAVSLAGLPADGVPFTAQLDRDGLLSWAGDPPVGSGPLGGPRESWRLSVCRRLGEHLAAAKRASLRRVTPPQYALSRLARDGVRLPSFSPAALPPPEPAWV
jgi:hypothetical protein